MDRSGAQRAVHPTGVLGIEDRRTGEAGELAERTLVLVAEHDEDWFQPSGARALCIRTQRMEYYGVFGTSTGSLFRSGLSFPFLSTAVTA